MVQVTEPQTQVPEIRLVMVEAKARRESQPLIAETALLHASTVTANRQPTSNERKTKKLRTASRVSPDTQHLCADRRTVGRSEQGGRSVG